VILVLSDEERRRRKNEANKRWRKANPEKSREYARRNREKYPERAREVVKKYQEKNPEKVKASRKIFQEKNRERLKAESKKYREKNYEKVREREKKWLVKNREKARERVRKWKEEYPEKARESYKKYREKNPEEYKERVTKWRRENFELVQGYRRKHNRTHPHANTDDMTKYRIIHKKCEWLDCNSITSLHVHHILPQHKYSEGVDGNYHGRIGNNFICFCPFHHFAYHFTYAKKRNNKKHESATYMLWARVERWANDSKIPIEDYVANLVEMLESKVILA